MNHLLFCCRPPIYLEYPGFWIHNSVYGSHSPWLNFWHVIIWYLADGAVWNQILFVRNLIKAKLLHRCFRTKKLCTRFMYLFKDDILLCCRNSVIPNTVQSDTTVFYTSESASTTFRYGPVGKLRLVRCKVGKLHECLRKIQ